MRPKKSFEYISEEDQTPKLDTKKKSVGDRIESPRRFLRSNFENLRTINPIKRKEL